MLQTKYLIILQHSLKQWADLGYTKHLREKLMMLDAPCNSDALSKLGRARRHYLLALLW